MGQLPWNFIKCLRRIRVGIIHQPTIINRLPHFLQNLNRISTIWPDSDKAMLTAPEEPILFQNFNWMKIMKNHQHKMFGQISLLARLWFCK